MTGRFAAVLLGAAVVSAAPATAQTPAGPHFTFTVPVRLTNLPPEIQTWSVGCAVKTGRFGPILGAGITRGGVAGVSLGALNADVVVNVTADPLKDPALATDYACNVSLLGAAPPGSAPGAGPFVYLDFSNTRFPLAPGAPFLQTTQALFPR